MLVRNLRKRGDYEKSILSQEELLRMAIANDRNVSQARALAFQGQLPELTPQQQMSKEEELTDALAIQAKAQENLLTLYPKETVTKFMEGLSKDSMTYLNVYWNDLKPVFKNKSGLSKRYFDRILKKHIDAITDSRGMSVVPSTGFKNASLNELAEVKFSFLFGDSPIYNRVLKALETAAKTNKEAANTLINLKAFKDGLPTEKILNQVSQLSDDKKSEFFKELIDIYTGTTVNPQLWEDASISDTQEIANKVDRLFPTLNINDNKRLRYLYANI